MSRREQRRKPWPPPPGYHWEVTESHFQQGGTPCFADFWLVEDGRSIDKGGMYEDDLTPERPGPWRRAIPFREHHVRTETRREVQRFEREQANTERTEALRQQYRP